MCFLHNGRRDIWGEDENDTNLSGALDQNSIKLLILLKHHHAKARVTYKRRMQLTDKMLRARILCFLKRTRNRAFFGEIKSLLHVWQRWAESARLTHGKCYKNEHPSISLHSANEGCCFGQAHNASILRVMVIVATDGSGDVFAVHAEADDVQEGARSFIITRQGRPFILPLR